MIETVRGPIPQESLGRVLPHEHIFALNPELQINWPRDAWDEETQVARARKTLNELKAAGIDTLVDLTVMGLGRDIRLIQRVAGGTDLNIVVATGYYSYKDLPAYFQMHGPGRRVDMPEPLVDMFVGDIEEGIAGTKVKAGIIKIATDKFGMTPDVDRIFRAAAEAHRRTGVTITTHTHAASRGGLEQQKLLKECGVNLTRVVIGHSGDSDDLDYLREMMDAGSTLGMDRFGMDNFLSTEKRLEVVAALCAEGYADRLTLSHDAAVFSINTEPEVRARMLPDWNYFFVPRTILPALRERGVTDAQIDEMTISVPRRILTRGA